MYRSKSSARSVPEFEMAAHPPVEIGTKGTVGSLLMQEIEYFSQLKLSSRESSKKHHLSVRDVASSSSQARPIVGQITGQLRFQGSVIGT
ncbi:hypothetical protein DITRI_Ditri01bG0175400 [Diplodiscus trichospermus]